MIAQKPVTRWSEVGQWYKGPSAPNGSVQGTDERRTTTYSVFTADYYGKGEKLYMRVERRLEYVVDGQVCSSRLPSAEDGHPDRIHETAARCGVSL